MKNIQIIYINNVLSNCIKAYCSQISRKWIYYLHLLCNQNFDDKIILSSLVENNKHEVRFHM